MLRVSYCVVDSVLLLLLLDVELLLEVKRVEEKSRVLVVPPFTEEVAADRKPETPTGTDEKTAEEKSRSMMAVVVVVAAAEKWSFISRLPRRRLLLELNLDFESAQSPIRLD